MSWDKGIHCSHSQKRLPSLLNDIEHLIHSSAQLECKTALETVSLYCTGKVLKEIHPNTTLEDLFGKIAEGLQPKHIKTYGKVTGKKGIEDIPLTNIINIMNHTVWQIGTSRHGIKGLLNIPEYNHLKIVAFGNENVFMVGKNRHIGFGPTLYKNGPVTEETINTHLYNHLVSFEDLRWPVSAIEWKNIASHLPQKKEYTQALMHTRTNHSLPMFISSSRLRVIKGMKPSLIFGYVSMLGKLQAKTLEDRRHVLGAVDI